MSTAIDQALAAVQIAEATYTGDVAQGASLAANVVSAQAAVATAQAAADAQNATIATDASAYVSALQALVTAANTEISSLTPAPPVA